MPQIQFLPFVGQLANTKIYEFVYGVNQLIGHKGFVANILKDIPMYFKPGFHPSQMN